MNVCIEFMSGMFSLKYLGFSQVLADFLEVLCFSEEIKIIFVEDCKTFDKNRTICFPIEFTSTFHVGAIFHQIRFY